MNLTNTIRKIEPAVNGVGRVAKRLGTNVLRNATSLALDGGLAYSLNTMMDVNQPLTVLLASAGVQVIAGTDIALRAAYGNGLDRAFQVAGDMYKGKKPSTNSRKEARKIMLEDTQKRLRDYANNIAEAAGTILDPENLETCTGLQAYNFLYGPLIAARDEGYDLGRAAVALMEGTPKLSARELLFTEDGTPDSKLEGILIRVDGLSPEEAKQVHEKVKPGPEKRET